MRKGNKVESQGLGIGLIHGNILSTMSGTEEVLNKGKSSL